MLGWKKLTFNAHSLPGLRTFGASEGDTGPGGGTYAWVEQDLTDAHNLKYFYRSFSKCGESPAGHVSNHTCYSSSQTNYVDPDDNPFQGDGGKLHMAKFDWDGLNGVDLKDSDSGKDSGMFQAKPGTEWRVQFKVKCENAAWFEDVCKDEWNNPNWVSTSGKGSDDSKVSFILDGKKGDYFSFDVDQDWGQVGNTVIKINGSKACNENSWNPNDETYIDLQKVWKLEETNQPVNAEMSAWGDWQDCINGGQKRERTVLIAAANGGTAAGDIQENRNCTVLEGCTEPNAKNYNSQANKNVGCEYWTCNCPENRRIKANGQCGACDTGFMVDPDSDCCIVDPDYDDSGGSDDEEEETNNTPLIIGGVAVVGLLAVMMMRK
jgi:hypothetical protein